MRTCKICNIEKELSCFYKRRQSYQYTCKHCQNETVKKWRVENKANYAVYERNRKLKSIYGIDLEQYNNILKRQNNSCAICKRKDSGRKDKDNFAVDHCHSTNKVRGLLCMECNTAIGKFKDNVDFLKSAIKYLNV
jgi:hypothetical protein